MIREPGPSDSIINRVEDILNGHEGVREQDRKRKCYRGTALVSESISISLMVKSISVQNESDSASKAARPISMVTIFGVVPSLLLCQTLQFCIVLPFDEHHTGFGPAVDLAR